MTSRMFVVPARIMVRRSKPKRDAAVRRCAVFERIEQEAETLPGLLRRHAQRGEQPRLHFRVVNTDAAAAALRSR